VPPKGQDKKDDVRDEDKVREESVVFPQSSSSIKAE
jgi:hypothetical protein